MRFETGNKLSGGRPRGSRNRLAGRVRPTNPLPPAADLSDGLPARAPAPIPPLTASQQSSSSKVQPHRVRTQLERPSERNPGGTIAEGWYRVSGGVVYVEDLQGRPLGSHPLRPGEDAEAIARRILNQKSSGASQFYGPINYPLECTEGPPLSSGDPPPRVVLTGGAFLPRLHSRGRGIFSTLQCRHPLQWATSCRRVASYEWKRVIVSLSATAMTHFCASTYITQPRSVRSRRQTRRSASWSC